MVIATSCKRLSFPSDSKGELIARVGEQELYLEDVKSIFSSEMTEQDSIDLQDSYVDKWVKTQIKIAKASEMFADDNDDIEKLINEYRNSLLINKYDSYHTQNIDTLITADDISDYYDLYKNSFRLRNPIVTATIVVYPKKYRGEKKLLELLSSKKDDDKLDLVDIVEKNDLTIFEYNDWTYFTEVLQNIPFSEKKFDEFLKKNSKYEIEDNDNKYVMAIYSYKNSGDYTPQAMVESVIKKMIINERKNICLKQVEDSIYNVSLIEEKIEINSNSENNKSKIEI